ncbi:hypothetical protein U27_01577 [Candidatus Vecturithrix granuli]|uniref:Uncharacterized protein n=1 Tax=Vecturithrix granuli TaxID=1499967 RepID=A0A081CAS1_VECG1|nr:hypothetical protein U27_01577 [Candidatus Vecturithrix granuli]
MPSEAIVNAKRCLINMLLLLREPDKFDQLNTRCILARALQSKNRVFQALRFFLQYAGDEIFL